MAGGLLTLHTFLRGVLLFIGYRRLCMLHSSHMATQSCSTLDSYDRNQRELNLKTRASATRQDTYLIWFARGQEMQSKRAANRRCHPNKENSVHKMS